MNGDKLYQGSLFAEDFLLESVGKMSDWQDISDTALAQFETDLREIFTRFPTDRLPNESQTEDDLIWPILGCLGWKENLRQQNLSTHGREDVPDGLLFADDAAKERANSLVEDWKRYEHGLVVVESKRWLRPLDRRSGRRGEETAPSTQMLRYLRRVDDLTTGKLRWGVLTNGARWRLYYAGARSVSEQYFEINLAMVLNVPGHDDSALTLSVDDRRHWLKVFMLIFGREAFLPDAVDERTFHQRAIAEGRFYQERLAANLSDLTFQQVFPAVAQAIADAAPGASLPEVRDAALVLLYRLLFILYAEDRDLLPVRDTRYDDYALREKVRGDVGRRMDADDVFSGSAAQYWSIIDDLCRAIDKGDASIGLPPYNGGLFDQQRTPLLGRVRLSDAVISKVIDTLSFEQTSEGRRYINYRDLGVQQLGSIYERLLEQEIIRDGDQIVIRPNIFARKDSGSYYTPDDLVGLIVTETLDPLVQTRLDAFTAEASELATNSLSEDLRMGKLRRLDPAEKLLELKVCDPAMGSGHFLVNLVDHLTDQVITAMAEAEATLDGYISPLTERIDSIRNTIMANAEERNWAIDPAQLDDRHIVRRMVLKRCVYGVDKNPMAVELTKVSLWLHTFTVGAPLSFLDHHLRCGDSLFGAWVSNAVDRAKHSRAKQQGGSLFLQGPVSRAMRSASSMQIIEGLTDAEIAEAHRSADVFTEVSEMTAPLDAFLSLLHAFDWMDLSDSDDKTAYLAYLDGTFGDPVDIAQGSITELAESNHTDRFSSLLEVAQKLITTERFLNWQVVFPGVWSDWKASGLTGGFDAVIGNPPWDKMRLQKVEWFAARRPEVALAPHSADRKQMITELEKTGDSLAQDFAIASQQAAAGLRIAKKSGDYPQLSRGDVNLYSLFVERAMTLVKRNGMIGLLVPSGIASDKMAARFFKSVSTEGRLKTLYDFENRRPRYNSPPFFPDVDGRQKFCIFVASPSPLSSDARCAFFLQDVSEIKNQDRCFLLNASDFARVNPNTGTAPIFRSRRDAELTTAIYDRLPILVNRSSGKAVKVWPVKYTTMFHMANDSDLFRTREELEEKERAWPTGGNRFGSPSGEWVPLYEGKMVQAFDHRAAGIQVNPENLFRTGQPASMETFVKANPDNLPEPRYWVLDAERWESPDFWIVSFKNVTSSTNMRTMIAAILPKVGAGHSLPLLPILRNEPNRGPLACFIIANLNAIVFDYVARQKVPTNNFTWYLLEQLPVVPPDRYEKVRFGPKTAAEIVREVVLELTYTAHDMAPFACDVGHVDEMGEVCPPFRWDEDKRLCLRAKLDALYFHLYGVTDRDDIRYIYSTFPIIEREERESWRRYRSRDLCLAWVNALAAGDTEAQINL